MTAAIMSTGVALSGFNVGLYTGNGTTRDVPLGFNPNLTLIQNRAGGNTHVFDSVRGVTNYLLTNSLAAQATDANSLTAFGSGGFTVGSASITNTNAANYASWNWAESSGYFDALTFTGTEPTPQNVPHNLGATPDMMWVKSTGSAGWFVYHSALGSGYAGSLNTSGQISSGDTTTWNATSPNNTQFTVGNSTSNKAGTMVAYLWAAKAGISAFGSYVGNGTSKTVVTNVPGKLLLIKCVTVSGDWVMLDTSRGATSALTLNDTTPSTISGISIDPTGFTLATSNPAVNDSGKTYIYAEWA